MGFFPLYLVIPIVFALISATWLRHELKHPATPLTRHWKWLAAVAVLQCIAFALYVCYGGKLGNFLLHSIGGGAVSTCLFVYIHKTLSIRADIRILTVCLFGFISSLGVLNELAEFTGELLHVATFSFDNQDTWRDLAANTIGAFTLWFLILFGRTIHKIARKHS